MSKLETKHTETASEDDWSSLNHVHTLVLMMVTALGIYLCYSLVAPFLPVIVWALTLAVMFAPLQRWLEAKVRYSTVAALISILIIGFIVVVPAVFVGEQLLEQVVKGSQLIESKVDSGEWRRVLEAQPKLAPVVKKIERYVNLPEIVKTLNAKLGSVVGAVVKGSLLQVLGFVLVFYVLFFFLRDRHLALKSMMALSPFTQMEMGRLFNQVGDTIHAIVYGTFAIAVVQGCLGGLMFWWLGLPAPLLWGLVMSLLAVVPMMGTSVIWAPAALFLALEGNLGSALILTLWGMLVIGTIDNLLRPIFVGNRLKLHTILAFMSIVGGLLLFGPAGLILGPVTLTVTIALLEIWLTRTSVRAAEFQV
ncbi:MAG TPA: AI-2E family transporter [Methylotenera sp.]|nr:AI-2E family transporter [Methylotenera sp.]HPV44690.1 AI-2E family transporter [Methylotenera sp.]